MRQPLFSFNGSSRGGVVAYSKSLGSLPSPTQWVAATSSSLLFKWNKNLFHLFCIRRQNLCCRISPFPIVALPLDHFGSFALTLHYQNKKPRPKTGQSSPLTDQRYHNHNHCRLFCTFSSTTFTLSLTIFPSGKTNKKEDPAKFYPKSKNILSYKKHPKRGASLRSGTETCYRIWCTSIALDPPIAR